VCGVVQNLYVGHKHESGDEPQGGGEEKKSDRSKRERASAKTVSTHASQAFTMSELETLDQTRIAVGQIGYLMTGGLCRVCKVDADIAPIKAGDLLTTSPTKGHAQKVTNAAETVGAVLGKALGSLKKGKGTIPVLVTL